MFGFVTWSILLTALLNMLVSITSCSISISYLRLLYFESGVY